MWIRTDTRLEKIEGLKIELSHSSSIWTVYAYTSLFSYAIYKGSKEECNIYLDNLVDRLTHNEKRIVINR